MSDFINKIVAITLAFVMLVLAPLLISYKSDEMLAKRLILNDVSQFIDSAQDTATITEENLNKLYTDCNSHGMAVNVTVKRMIRTNINKDGKIETVYYADDSLDGLKSLNPRDIVKVSVEEVGISAARRITYSLLKIDEGKFQFSLAGAVG